MNVLAQADTLPISEPEIWWFALSPLLTLVGGALLLMVVGALTPQWPRGLYAFVSAMIGGAAGVLAIFNWDDISDNGPATLVGGALAFDTFAMWSTIVISGAVVLVSMLADEYIRDTPNDGPEIYALLLVAAAGGIVMASANDLIVLFLGLETLSLAFYVLAASNRRSDASAESGLKYFLLGGFASAFFLYGIALVYGATGSTNIGEMVTSLANRGDSGNDVLALAGIALLLVGLGFKIAAAPFHVWTPDVYQGAPTPITAFMASAGKAAAFGALIRVLISGLPSFRDDWQPIIWVLAVASLVVGSFLAVVQRNVKRMLAYSSVSHAGFILVGVEAAAHTAGEADGGMGISSVQLYLLLYSVIVIGSFGVVALVAREADADLSVFDGLAKRKPLLAGAFTIFLLAQAGVPFTTGFIAKFGVIQAGVDAESYGLAIIAMVTAVIAAFVYLRIMVAMWQKDVEDDAPAITVPVSAAIAIGFAAVFTLVAGLYPSLLIDWSDAITLVR
ncbi:NADH-quinone oxidoreductase subunit N [Ilumatobacter nonamiensis]|uniref:NADH-quinone oxidoreductase subunit N n=1 Tax=Ilumatobacter nonamiensis TaxID=467093 RepID=UPI000349613E|nr:NADH-quinone oxidoreductase subunit N [Ilumatobacter nonamiensis]